MSARAPALLSVPWRDPLYGLALAAALPAVVLIAAATPAVLTLRWPGVAPVLLAVVVLPVLEEIVFRLGVQDALATRIRGRIGALTLANGLTAICFAAAHLWQHPPVWALATFVPALVFGALWERHGRLLSPISVHGFYNATYLCLLGGPTGVS